MCTPVHGDNYTSVPAAVPSFLSNQERLSGLNGNAIWPQLFVLTWLLSWKFERTN